jgi:hypothetical protein
MQKTLGHRKRRKMKERSAGGQANDVEAGRQPEDKKQVQL